SSTSSGPRRSPAAAASTASPGAGTAAHAGFTPAPTGTADPPFAPGATLAAGCTRGLRPRLRRGARGRKKEQERGSETSTRSDHEMPPEVSYAITHPRKERRAPLAGPLRAGRGGRW